MTTSDKKIMIGYSTDLVANYMKEDSLLKLVLDKESLAFQPTISRYWYHFTEGNIGQMQAINQTRIDRIGKNTAEIVIDLGTPHSDIFGK